MTEQPGSQAIAGIEAAYADIRQRHPELPERIMIVTGVGSRPRGGMLRGSFTPGCWSHNEDHSDSLDEIKITGERMEEGSLGVLTTLIHECVHKICDIRKIQETSPSNVRYHNKKFLKVAEELGLKLNRTWPGSGYSDCYMTTDTKTDYETTLKALDLALPVHLKTKRRTKGPDRNNPKAVCLCEPERIVRASRKVLEEGMIRCELCDSYFQMI